MTYGKKALVLPLDIAPETVGRVLGIHFVMPLAHYHKDLVVRWIGGNYSDVDVFTLSHIITLY